jgi:hypothetical protein
LLVCESRRLGCAGLGELHTSRFSSSTQRIDARRTIAFAASLALSDPAQIRDEQGDEIAGTAGVSARAVHARQSLEPFVMGLRV